MNTACCPGTLKNGATLLQTASSIEAQFFLLEQAVIQFYFIVTVVGRQHEGQLTSKYYPGGFGAWPLSVVGKNGTKKKLEVTRGAFQDVCESSLFLHCIVDGHFQIGRPPN